MSDAVPHDPVAEPPRKISSARRFSAVWLVPLIALAISLTVAWRTYSGRGPLIDIVLDNAAGIEAGQTTVRFRDVTVGVVEEVGFTSDLRNVRVSVRVDLSVVDYVNASAQFWVVRPSVTSQGVTGIETVLSGVYIAAYWSAEPGPFVDSFTALERPPLTPGDQPGKRVSLRAPDGGSISAGAPILYKRIAVGKIEAVDLTPEGEVRIDAFIGAPYDQFVTQGSRFWNSSGFSINLGAGGASLNVESLAALLQGGVSFAQVGSALDPADPGQVFELYASEGAARENVIEALDGARLSLTALFNSTVSGLQPGAKVDFRGVSVGEVTSFQPVIVPGPTGPNVLMQVSFDVIPERLGAPPDAPDPTEAGLDLIAQLVNQGLRARLASSGLLSQNLHLELAELPEAEPAALDRDAEPAPAVPSAPSDVSGLAASAESVMNRIAALPIEELMTTVTTLLANVNTIVTDESVRSAPANLGALIADIREIVETSGIKETPAQIAETLASIQAIVEATETQEVVETLARTLDATRVTIEKFGAAADGLPLLLGQVSTLTARVNDLPLDRFLASATETIDGIDALIRSENVANLPASVNAALDEARGVIADLRAGGAVNNVNASLASLRGILDELQRANLTAQIATAVEAAQRAAASVDDAASGLPALVDNLETLSNDVSALPLDEFVASATRTLDAAETVLAAEGTARLPSELADSLEQVRLLLAELREGGAVASVNQTLASADEAANAVAQAARELPALIAQLDGVAQRANAALSGYAPGSEFNRETQSLIRDLRNAAQSVNTLALALERRPNSVLFGR